MCEIEKADNIRTVTSESKESNIIPEYVVEQSEKAGNKIAKEQRLPCLFRQAGRI